MSSVEAEAFAIVGGTIIDGNGGKPINDGVILIEGKRVAGVGINSHAVAPQTKKISAAGKYIMPGMMDANVHLFLFIIPGELMRYEGHYEELIAEAAQVALKNGLTTVFDTWGPREALTHVRDRINQGHEVGSRIFFAGNIIGLGGPTSSDFLPISRSVFTKSEADAIDSRWEQGVGRNLLWMTPTEVRDCIRAYVQGGHQNFLKYASSGHALTHFEYICFSEKVQRIIVEEGHRAGITVQAHTTSPESLRMEIDAGADLLQHPDLTGSVPLPQETLDVIAQRNIPCAAMFATRRYLEWSNAHDDEFLRIAQRIKDENDRRLVIARAPILLTTDAGVFPADTSDHRLGLTWRIATADQSPVSMGEAHFRWLEAAAELGMRPMDALMAATRNCARAYKIDKELGTLEAGKIADLLILDKNPLEDPANYRSISLVMKEGRIIDRDSLPTKKLFTSSSTAQTMGRQPYSEAGRVTAMSRLTNQVQAYTRANLCVCSALRALVSRWAMSCPPPSLPPGLLK